MTDLCFGVRGVESLKNELARVRDNLRDTDATIEKLTGRPAATFANRSLQRFPGQARFNADEGRGRGRASLFALANYDNTGPPLAKRPGGPFARLGFPTSSTRPFPPRRNRDEEDDDDLPHKPAISSSVVATPKDTKTRKEAIAEQQSGNGGSVGQGRNRRMFGLLLGTLVKFREDERTKEDQEIKRKAVERRLEEKQHEERERVVLERQQLFSDRRRQQVKLRSIEQKIELVEMHNLWELESKNLECFIRTNARPHVFFLPKSHIPASLAKLEESKRVLQALVTERRKQLEEEIEEIMAQGDQNKVDHKDAEEESDEEMDESALADDEKTTDKTANQVSTSAADGDALSDIDDNDHGGIEYSLSADVGNVDSIQMPSNLNVNLIDAKIVTMEVDEESHPVVGPVVEDTEQPINSSEATKEIPAAEKESVNSVTDDASESIVQDEDRSGVKEKHPVDSEPQQAKVEEEISSKDRKHGSRDEERERSKRQARRRDEDKKTKRRDRHNDDSRSRDRHHGSSRHRRRESSRDDHKKKSDSKRRHNSEKDSTNRDKEKRNLSKKKHTDSEKSDSDKNHGDDSD